MCDVTYNRVFWEYIQTKSYMRPLSSYFCHELVPSLGVKVLDPPYKKCDDFKKDYTWLVRAFKRRYPNKRFVLALSGGIDSEVCAETFYQLDIPFRAISLRLFDGANDFDIAFAARYCKTRNIDYKIYNLSLSHLKSSVIPKAVEFGQFTHSASQCALTHLFDHVADDEILIMSGHNPDYHPQLGFGWMEDSINMVKYAINTDKRFMTFTSLESIFVHYMKNFDASLPGGKNNDFIYKAFPTLSMRKKMTGWEAALDQQDECQSIVRKLCNHAHATFVTWPELTLRRKLEVEKNLDEYFQKHKLQDTWLSYKLQKGVKSGIHKT